MIWHSAPLSDVLNELKTGSENGLSPAEAAERLRKVGLNQLKAEEKSSPFRHLLSRLADPWSILLVLAVVVTIIINLITGSGSWWEPILILAVLLLNAAFTAIFKQKAERALSSLNAGVKSTAQVLRGGKQMAVSSELLVPGDIVLLSQGALIPADGRLLECTGLSCDESALTGESAPCEKDAAVLPDDITPLDGRRNMVYMGCTVLHGTAVFAVTDTGLSAEYGKQVLLARQNAETNLPAKKRLDSICRAVSVGAALAGLLLFILLFAFTSQGAETFAAAFVARLMLSVAFVVAILPESISVIFTVSIAQGILKMARQHAVLKNISKIENLAAVSVICADKTGTMTQNKMQLRQIFDGNVTVDLKTTEPTENMKTLLQMGALCCDASVELTSSGKQLKRGDATEAAIVAACLKYCGLQKQELENTYPRMYAVPFDSQRQLMTTVNMINNRHYAIVKGAPDKLLACCTTGNFEAAKAQIEAFSANALRVIAVGMKPLDALDANPTAESMECDLTLMGIFGLGDAIREDTVNALQSCESAGIRTVILTGDNRITAEAAGKQLGILKGDLHTATGEQLAALTDEDLCAAVSKIGVYSRLDAAGRDRVIKAYRDRGEVVAVTGDEVRDSLALKTADVGFALGQKGTDAAKSSADVVLTDDSFSAAVQTVALARNTLSNIKRAIGFLFSSNLGELIFMLLGVVLFRLPPLTALGLLWINLITDCAPAVALATVTPTKMTMHQKPTERGHWFGAALQPLLALQGAAIAAVSLIAFAVGQATSPEVGISAALFTLGLSQLFGAVNTLSNSPLFLAKPRLSLTANAAFLCGLLLLLLSAFTPLASLFGGCVLPAGTGFTCFALAAAVPVTGELIKLARTYLLKPGR